jgi:hypothetical protein
MNRRALIALLFASRASPAESSRIGRLDNSSTPFIRQEGRPSLELAGDEESMAVLSDRRLKGETIEVRGRVDGGRFRLDPSHTSPLRVIRSGKRLFVTYWCDTCAIRTYAPGICVCCREDTELDLREAI